MKKEYYKFWRIRYNKPKFPLSIEEAEKRHQGKERYVVTFLQENNIKYVVELYFDDFFCTIMYLTPEKKRCLEEHFVRHEQGLFLREKTFLHDNGVAKLGYLYETDGRYRKTLFEKERGGIIDQTFGTTDVSSCHFREMIEFGKYDSILPQSPDE